ncbi:MAG: phosphoenolpyruvate carboxykinase, partial [Tenericutes bacterium HGW-Tenericutes-6]
VGDYLRHWLDMGKKSNEALLPKIFYVNWFRKDEQGDFLWPGFGHNSRVLKWIFERTDGQGQGDLTPIGYVPKKDALDVRGLPMKADALDQLLDVNIDEWLLETKSIRMYYESIGEKMPDRLYQELDKLETRLQFEKEKTQTEAS